MIATIIIVFLAFIWLAYEAGWISNRSAKRVTPIAPAVQPEKLTTRPDNGTKQNTLGKVLTGVIAVILLAGLGTLIYVLQVPLPKQTFTEFYILGLSGKASDYPKELALGEDGNLIVGIVNHENRVAIYNVEIAIDGVANTRTGQIALANGEKWEGYVNFKPARLGDKQKVEFFLNDESGISPRQELYLWVNVKTGK